MNTKVYKTHSCVLRFPLFFGVCGLSSAVLEVAPSLDLSSVLVVLLASSLWLSRSIFSTLMEPSVVCSRTCSRSFGKPEVFRKWCISRVK